MRHVLTRARNTKRNVVLRGLETIAPKADSWFMARKLSIVVFAALGLLAAACGGLSESKWRRELEPLLPQGVTIVNSKTGNCTIEPNCSVSFELEHDRSRYADDVTTFEASMEAEGWTKTSGGQSADAARVQFERKGIRVSMKLLSPSWRERCVESQGADVADCKSVLVVLN